MSLGRQEWLWAGDGFGMPGRGDATGAVQCHGIAVSRCRCARGGGSGACPALADLLSLWSSVNGLTTLFLCGCKQGCE